MGSSVSRKLNLLVVSCIVTSLICSSVVSAELTYPTDDKSFVIDDANVLNETEEQDLEKISEDLFNGWGTNIIIVIINSTADYQSSDDNGNESENQSLISVSDYTVALYDHWRVDSGNEWKDGVLLVLSTNQSGSWQWWFELGCFWESNMYVFDDIGSTADSSFDDGNWSQGLTIVSQDLSTQIDDYWYENDGYVDVPNCVRDSTNQEQSADFSGGIFGFICLGILIAIVILIIVISRSGFFNSNSIMNQGYGQNYNQNHNQNYNQNHNTNNQYVFVGDGNRASNAPQPHYNQQPQTPSRRDSNMRSRTSSSRKGSDGGRSSGGGRSSDGGGRGGGGGRTGRGRRES